MNCNIQGLSVGFSVPTIDFAKHFFVCVCLCRKETICLLVAKKIYNIEHFDVNLIALCVLIHRCP